MREYLTIFMVKKNNESAIYEIKDGCERKISISIDASKYSVYRYGVLEGKSNFFPVVPVVPGHIDKLHNSYIYHCLIDKKICSFF